MAGRREMPATAPMPPSPFRGGGEGGGVCIRRGILRAGTPVAGHEDVHDASATEVAGWNSRKSAYADSSSLVRVGGLPAFRAAVSTAGPLSGSFADSRTATCHQTPRS